MLGYDGYIMLVYATELTTTHHRYRQTSNIKRTKFQNLHYFPTRVAVVFDQSIEGRCWVEYEDVIWAAQIYKSGIYNLYSYKRAVMSFVFETKAR